MLRSANTSRVAYVCPCGCGAPVWPIAGGFSTPTSDMHRALVATVERSEATLADLFGKNQPETKVK